MATWGVFGRCWRLERELKNENNEASVHVKEEKRGGEEQRTSILGLSLRLDLLEQTLLLLQDLQQLLLVLLLGSLDLSNSTLRDLLELLLVAGLDVLELVV